MKLEEERGADHQDEGEVYMMVHAYHAWPMTTTAISSGTQWQLEVKHGLSYTSPLVLHFRNLSGCHGGGYWGRLHGGVELELCLTVTGFVGIGVLSLTNLDGEGVSRLW